jgi:hypothetical protein
MLRSMGFLMSKIHSLVNPFHSKPALFARVCLPAPWQAGLPGRRTGSQATLRRHHHRKTVSADLNLYPSADLSLTPHHTRHRCPTLQNA